MRYRHLISLKTVVLRSCVRQVSAGHAGGAYLQPLTVRTHPVSLQARCLSTSCHTAASDQNRTPASPSLFGCNRTGIRTPPLHSIPNFHTACSFHLRCLHSSPPASSAGKEDVDDEPIVAKYDESGKPLSNWKRMKMMMKTYGYVIIPVHWVIAPVWFGAFYYVIKMGVDIGPMLLKIRVSEHHVHSLQNSRASNALMAYALYKIFTPLRYTVTVGATEMSVRYLRRKGYIKPTPLKEKSYRDSMRETVEGMKDKVQDVKDKAQERVDDLKDKAQDLKDKAQDLKDKAQDIRDKRKS